MKTLKHSHSMPYLLLFSPPLGRHLSTFTQAHYDPPLHLCVISALLLLRKKGEDSHKNWGNEGSDKRKLETLGVWSWLQWTSYLGVRIESQDDFLSQKLSYLPHTVHISVLVYSDSESVWAFFFISLSQVSPNSDTLATVLTPSLFQHTTQNPTEWELHIPCFPHSKHIDTYIHWLVYGAAEVSAFRWQMEKRGVIDLVHFPPYVAIKRQTRAKSIEVYKGCCCTVDIMLWPLWIKQSKADEEGTKPGKSR